MIYLLTKIVNMITKFGLILKKYRDEHSLTQRHADIDIICNVQIVDYFDLKSPAIREIDKAWARIITHNDDVDELLNSALRYLTILAKNRES